MMRPKLGSIQQVPLRCVWPNEGTDFTPWVAKNLHLLGEAVQMELNCAQTEAFTGRYWLDILAKDVKTGETVAIENQLEWTDNSHLGQTLTYAARFDARTLIWVARRFNNVHRAALEWLNRCTADGIKIYGVEVNLLRIGDSLPAPEFIAVVIP